jgi:hypothetical protein
MVTGVETGCMFDSEPYKISTGPSDVYDLKSVEEQGQDTFHHKLLHHLAKLLHMCL